MIFDDSSSKTMDLKTRLYQIVAEERISSLSMISDMVAASEDQTRILLEELVEESALAGSFTPDGQRFFLSEVSISSAPLAPTRDEGFEITKVDTRNGKLVFLVGITMMIAGYIIQGIPSMNVLMENTGFAIVMVGLIVLVTGWLMITRADPPSSIN